MNILMFLIPVSMLFLGLAVWAFIWAVKRGQFEDLDTSALDILREDEHDRPYSPSPSPSPSPPPAAPSSGEGAASAEASKQVADNAQRDRDAE